MVRKIVLLISAIALFICSCAAAEMKWETETPAQEILMTYIETANQYLTSQKMPEINRIFEIYPGFAVLGIASDPDTEVPENVEITVTMYQDTLNRLELRVSDPAGFPAVAAALICAMYSEPKPVEEAIAIPTERAQQAQKAPGNSFEETVDELNGTIPRIYYAYYPDQYHDGKNWLQMTIIFPQGDFGKISDSISGGTETDGSWTYADANEDYEGYFSSDDYTHLEIFATPTPEPDSAAAEYDFR